MSSPPVKHLKYFHSLPEIGSVIVDHLGFNTDQESLELSKKLSSDNRVESMLAAILCELRFSRSLLSQIRTQTRRFSEQTQNIGKTVSAQQISDGMMEWINQTRGKVRLNFFDEPYLTLRGMRVIARSGLKYFSDITEANLAPVPGCGPVTMSEIISWRDAHLQNNETNSDDGISDVRE